MEIIVLTDNASKHFKNALEKNAASYLRLTLIPGGCAGYKYGLSTAQENEPEDILVESNGITILIDSEQIPLLQGTTIDVAETLEGAALKINNPNFARSCGCGKSVG